MIAFTSFYQAFQAFVAPCFVLTIAWLLLFKWDTFGRNSDYLHHVSIHKTQILSCSISHHRLLPKKHGFSYPYLSVGIPVRAPSSNWLLSVDEPNWWRRGWFHVTAKDHLHRGTGGNTLAENIDTYLEQQNIDPAAFPHIYLLTSARFFNYKFSPASFWYLYTKELHLKHVIAEVNNTFDERRLYLFSAPKDDEKFKQTSYKDFHVSPFSSRRGSYVLETADPARNQKISVTITLQSSKGHPKLVARWWNTTAAIDASNYPIIYALWYLVRWGWTVLVTFPRIVYQAIILAQVHKLNIWYRPEPKESAIPRRATSDESFLESIFLRYVKHIYENRPKSASSVPSGIVVQTLALHEKYHIGTSTKETALELRIHTPAFYRSITTYPNLAQYLRHTLLDPYEENRTAWCEHAHRVIDWFQILEEHNDQRLPRKRFSGLALIVAWLLYSRLRILKPLRGTYPYPGLPTERAKSKTCHPSKLDVPGYASSLDMFVYENCNTWLQIRYMVATLSLQGRTRIVGAIGGE